MAAPKLTSSYRHVPSKRPFMGLSMGQQLYQAAEKYSDKEMYVFYVDKERVTFKQMKEKSQQFAASLLSKGYRRGDTIAVWGANHAEWLVALYATTQLGMLLVPLRLEFSNEMVGAALKKFKCKGLLLTRSPSNIWSRTCEIFPELKDSSGGMKLNNESFPDMDFLIISGTPPERSSSKRYVYSYDDFMALGSESDMDNVNEICMSLDMDEPCCLVFTSGSTGMPKGTVHSSHALLNNIRVSMDHDEFDYDLESSRFGLTITFSGGAAFVGMLAPLVLGLTTVVLFPEFNAVTMAKALQDERVSVAVFLIHHIHDLLNVPNIEDYDLSNLDLLYVGGSVIPFEMRRHLGTLCKHVIMLIPFPLDDIRDRIGVFKYGPMILKETVRDLQNVFGMTEVMMTLRSHPHDPEEKQLEAAMQPNYGIELKIVDDNGVTVPVNTLGELYLRTYSAFQYYVDEPKKTKETKDEDGWLHTGDLAVLDEDGYFYIRGRKKELIIKQGLNLAPAELEKRLYQHPLIKTAVVIGVPDPRVGEEICACLRVDGKDAPTTEEIRKFCDGKVHELLVPKYVLIFEEVPTTSTGKFSRPKLTELAKERLQIK